MQLAAQSLPSFSSRAGQLTANAEKAHGAIASPSEFVLLLGEKIQEIGANQEAGSNQGPREPEHQSNKTAAQVPDETQPAGADPETGLPAKMPSLAPTFEALPGIPAPSLSPLPAGAAAELVAETQQAGLPHGPGGKNPASLPAQVAGADKAQHLEKPSTGKSDRPNATQPHASKPSHETAVVPDAKPDPAALQPPKREDTQGLATTAAPADGMPPQETPFFGSPFFEPHISAGPAIPSPRQPAEPATKRDIRNIQASVGSSAKTQNDSDIMVVPGMSAEEQSAIPSGAAALKSTSPEPIRVDLPVLPATMQKLDSRRSGEEPSQPKDGPALSVPSAPNPQGSEDRAKLPAASSVDAVSRSVSAHAADLPVHGKSLEPTPLALANPQHTSGGGTPSSPAGTPRGGELTAKVNASPAGFENPFDRLDRASIPDATVIQGSAQRLTVGVPHPNLGWVEIKTQSTGDQVAATLVSSSDQTHQHLAGQLSSLTQYLTDREVKISSVTVHQQPASGGESEGRGSARNSQNHDARRGEDSSPSGFHVNASQPSDPGVIQDERRLSYIDLHA